MQLIERKRGVVALLVRVGSECKRLRHDAVAVGLVAAIGLSVAMAVVVAPDASATGLTLTVNSTGDDADAAAGDGVCETATPGECTLRAALREANSHAGHDTIEFAVPGAGVHTFEPGAPYPLQNDPDGVTIDGYSQPNATVNTLADGTNANILIELRGNGPSGMDGLYFQSPNNVVFGLAIFDFKRHIRLWGDNAHNNEIIGNFLGTNAAGTFGADGRVSNSNSVHMERGAYANRVGKPGSEHRNLLAGAGDKGVALYNDGTRLNLIQNNVFGLTPDGSAVLKNWGHGVDLNVGASNNFVGGWNLGEGNVISGSDLSGIEISHDGTTVQTTGNLILNNLIGTDLTGFGGPTYAANGEFGINFEGNERCADTCPPDISGNVAIGNTVVGSQANVIVQKAANANTISNNRLGVLLDGSIAASSAGTLWGVMLQSGAFDNVVTNNVIGGMNSGIQIKPTSDYPAGCLPTDTVCPEDAAFATYGNRLSANLIFDVTGGLGIDLIELDVSSGEYTVDGPTATSGPFVQGGIALPEIASATTDSLLATTCDLCTIEVYRTPTPTTGGWQLYGRAKELVATGAADATGLATIVFRSMVEDPYVVVEGDQVAVLTIDGAGNTSEHSLRLTVIAGSLGPPTSTTTTSSVPATTTTLPLPGTTTTSTTTTTTTTTTLAPPTSLDIEVRATGEFQLAKRCGANC